MCKYRNYLQIVVTEFGRRKIEMRRILVRLFSLLLLNK